MSDKTNSTGMLLDGIFASEAVDSSGEVFSVSGADISSFKDNTGFINWEHRSHDQAEIPGSEIVGKVVFAKKIYKEGDCDTDRQRTYWKKTKVPYIYGVARLYDGAGHAGAEHVAAIIRDSHANNEPVAVGWSIEGSTLDKKDNQLLATVCRRVAITVRPCNKTALLGMMADPNAPKGFSKEDDIAGMVKKDENGLYGRLGGSTEEYTAEDLEALNKAMTAGVPSGAPGSLTGGESLQVEDRGRKTRALALAAVRDYEPSKGKFRDYLKAQLPDVDDDFLDHFTELVEGHQLRLTKAAEAVNDLKTGNKDSNFGATEHNGKPLRFVFDKTKQMAVPNPAHPDFGNAPAVGANSPVMRMTIRGKKIAPRPANGDTRFENGVLHTKKGSFPMYIPKGDELQSFTDIWNKPDIEHFHSYATREWMRAHNLLKAGKLPPEVVHHAMAFSAMSVNTPVPVQELMYSVHQDVILVTCDQQHKKIKDFQPGDTVWGVDNEGRTVKNTVVALHDHGTLDGFEVTFDDGYRIVCSKNHKFLTQYGMTPLWRIATLGLGVYNESKTQREWLAESVRTVVSNGSQVQSPQEGVSILQGHLASEEVGACQELAPRPSGRVEGFVGFSTGRSGGLGGGAPGREDVRYSSMGEGASRGLFRSSSQGGSWHGEVAGAESGQVQGAPTGLNRSGPEVAYGESRNIRGERQEVGGFYQDQEGWFSLVQSGSMASVQRDVDLDGRSNQLPYASRRGTEASRLCRSGPQNLGGSGWVLPLLRVQERNLSGTNSIPGCDVESGSSTQTGCDIDSASWGVFSKLGRENDARVAGMAYGDAPLAQTGDLAVRRIVRVRFVGPCHMYDLEVSHPKHNFLLPNGIVTSNSHLADAMRHTGKDFLSDPKGIATLRADWLKRDRPDRLPKNSPEHWKRLKDSLTLGNDSKTTGRKVGDIGGFQLGEQKFDRMGDNYAALHGPLFDAIQRNGKDIRTTADEVLYFKLQEENHKNRQAIARRSGKTLPDYDGVSLNGWAPKTTRYALGMMGGGNTIVPDTHFVRYLFGLDRNADGPTIEYLKNTLWNPGNHSALKAIDQHYAQHHPAVKLMLQHPEFGSQFEHPEDAIFPAFWRNWMAILPHEKSRGMQTNGFNELTDHRPFWEHIAPMTKAEHYEGEHDGVRSATQHHRWVEQHGLIPAQMLYSKFILPQQLESAARRVGQTLVRKAQSLMVDLKKADPDIDFTDATPHKQNEYGHALVEYNGKLVKPGKMYDQSNQRVTKEIIEAGPNHFITVPIRTKQEIKSFHTDGTPILKPWWNAADLYRAPRHTAHQNAGATVHFPESIDTPLKVDPSQHSVGDYLHHDDIRKMVDGFDFGQPRKWSSVGIQKDFSYWAKAPDGSPVYVKRAPQENEFNAARKEALAYNLSRDYFGMDKYFAPTALVRHPSEGSEYAIVKGFKGSHSSTAASPDPIKAVRTANRLQNLDAIHDSGDLDKLAMMNYLWSNADRHHRNFMYTPDGTGLKLLDHGLAFHGGSVLPYWNANGRGNGFAGYLDDAHWRTQRTGKVPNARDPMLQPMHPKAVAWVNNLSPYELESQLARHEVPDAVREDMVGRLKSLQFHLKQPDAAQQPKLHLLKDAEDMAGGFFLGDGTTKDSGSGTAPAPAPDVKLPEMKNKRPPKPAPKTPKKKAANE